MFTLPLNHCGWAVPPHIVVFEHVDVDECYIVVSCSLRSILESQPTEAKNVEVVEQVHPNGGPGNYKYIPMRHWWVK
jgi:hypothetical protein